MILCPNGVPSAAATFMKLTTMEKEFFMIKNYTLLCRNAQWHEAAILLSCMATEHPHYQIFNIHWMDNNELYIDLTATSDEINNILKRYTQFEIYDIWEN